MANAPAMMLAGTVEPTLPPTGMSYSTPLNDNIAKDAGSRGPEAQRGEPSFAETLERAEAVHKEESPPESSVALSHPMNLPGSSFS